MQLSLSGLFRVTWTMRFSGKDTLKCLYCKALNFNDMSILLRWLFGSRLSDFSYQMPWIRAAEVGGSARPTDVQLLATWRLASRSEKNKLNRLSWSISYRRGDGNNVHGAADSCRHCCTHHCTDECESCNVKSCCLTRSKPALMKQRNDLAAVCRAWKVANTTFIKCNKGAS
ncbi:hypothetical protein KCU77_g87, partial [Aureobasidium melanogenum]